MFGKNTLVRKAICIQTGMSVVVEFVEFCVCVCVCVCVIEKLRWRKNTNSTYTAQNVSPMLMEVRNRDLKPHWSRRKRRLYMTKYTAIMLEITSRNLTNVHMTEIRAREIDTGNEKWDSKHFFLLHVISMNMTKTNAVIKMNVISTRNLQKQISHIFNLMSNLGTNMLTILPPFGQRHSNGFLRCLFEQKDLVSSWVHSQRFFFDSHLTLNFA